MLKVKLKIIGIYASTIWMILLHVYFVNEAASQIHSEHQAPPVDNRFPFTDFTVEAEVYSESKKTLRMKITWNPKVTKETSFDILVQPLHGGNCHDESCILFGQRTKNATLFVPQEPVSEDEYQIRICKIIPGCNYTVTVESDNFKSKLKYTVPDRVGNVRSCQHTSSLPNIISSVKVTSQLMTMYWKINETFQVPDGLKVYVIVLITTVRDLDNALGFFNHTLDNKHQQSGQFKWNIPSTRVLYFARLFITDSNDCRNIPETHRFYAPQPTESTPPTKVQKTEYEENSYTVHAIWLVSSVITLIVILIFFSKAKQANVANWPSICYRRRRRRRPVSSPMVNNANYVSLDEIPHSCLELFDEIGRGNFGRVYLARVENLFGKQGIQLVAVKQIKDEPTDEEKEEFMCEIQTMKKLSRHPNIVALLGYCTLKEPLQMIMEYVGCGDLLKYLRELRPRHENYYGGSRNLNPCQLFNNGITKIPSENHHPLLPNTLGTYLDVFHSSSSDSLHITESEATNLRPSVTETMCTTLSENYASPQNVTLEYILDHKELHSFATQIAKGMKHLHDNLITHRDLAARNILIDENKTLKISDFGLSRSGIYVNKKNKKVPLRWLSIEAMRDNLYSNKSDVWSFGIVLWEIGTLGGFPYPTVGNHELLAYLSDGHRLEQPANCSKYLYKLMLQTWADEPDDRPGFTEILSKLEPVHQKIYVDFSKLSSDYVFPPTMEQTKKNNFKVAFELEE